MKNLKALLIIICFPLLVSCQNAEERAKRKSEIEAGKRSVASALTRMQAQNQRLVDLVSQFYMFQLGSVSQDVNVKFNELKVQKAELGAATLNTGLIIEDKLTQKDFDGYLSLFNKYQKGAFELISLIEKDKALMGKTGVSDLLEQIKYTKIRTSTGFDEFRSALKMHNKNYPDGKVPIDY